MSLHENNGSRTLVEFYDGEYLENIISLLYGEYDQVVYVYFSQANEPTEADRKALDGYIHRQFGFSPRFLAIAENTIACALDAFRELTRDGACYDFDITGGSSVFIAAAGAMAMTGDGNITLHEYDPAQGKRIFSHPENAPAAEREHGVQLTVDDALDLQGIRILYPERPIRYRLKQNDLRGEIFRLWEAIRSDLRAWNALAAVPTDVKPVSGSFSVRKRMSARQKGTCARLLGQLSSHGIISDLREQRHNHKVDVFYQLHVPANALFLYDKGGNILEMLTYATAMDSGCFTDCCTGISLDWDERSSRGGADPYNEIDTVLTRGHTAYFISCKNTEVTKEYLYEIMVMTRHYGGKYAEAGLICTTRCNTHIHARAREMGVILIDGIASLQADGFAEKFLDRLDLQPE